MKTLIHYLKLKNFRKLVAGVALVLVLIVLLICRCTKKDTPKQQPDETVSESESVSQEEISTSKYSSDDKLIALTFDDGPGTATTDKILDSLEKHGAVATFFVVGYNLDENSDRVKRAAEMGCEIGNHSKGHKNISKLGTSEINEQVNYVNDKVEKLTGKRPALFRAPGGNSDGAADKVGMPLIQWDIDTEDWKYKDSKYPNRSESERAEKIEQIASRVANEAKSGDIVLMHDIYDFSADLAESIMTKLSDDGFKMVTVSEMFDAYGLSLVPGEVYRNAEKKVSVNKKSVEAGTYTVTTGGDTLNIRESADVNSAKLGSLPNGTVVTVTESVDGWAKITYNGITGWVSTAFLANA